MFSQVCGNLCLKKTISWLSIVCPAVCSFSLAEEITADEEAAAPNDAVPVNMASPLPSWLDLTGEPSQCKTHVSNITTRARSPCMLESVI